jgi:ABC-type uncharacterized transport system permease subunit
MNIKEYGFRLLVVWIVTPRIWVSFNVISRKTNSFSLRNANGCYVQKIFGKPMWFKVKGRVVPVFQHYLSRKCELHTLVLALG